ncbi:MAG TPA: ribosomal protein S18-alanine N-acetyltransferase [Terracidiphilus sp.]
MAGNLRDAPHWRPEAYRDMLDPARNPARVCLVAEDSVRQLVGFGVMILIPPQAELEAIAVTGERQRRGIARNLLSDLLSELKRLDITEVMLEVRESNRGARAFYRASEFVETGRRRGYYADPQEDALLMKRQVS